MKERFKIPFYIALHPISEAERAKENSLFSICAGMIITFLYFVSSIITTQYQSSNFSTIKPGSLNILMLFLKSVFLLIVFIISNWCVTTLLSGNGTFFQIFSCITYALIPVIIGTLISTLLTYILSMQEAVFVQWASMGGLIWTFIVGYLSLMTVHQFSFGKMLLSLVLTIAGVFIILFLILLFVSLMKEVFEFLFSVYYEIYYRWFAN